MAAEDGAEQQKGRPETIDSVFVASRQRIDMIIERLAEKISAALDLVALDESGLKHMDELLARLEKLVFLRQMNAAKVEALKGFAPKAYKSVLTDEAIRNQLKPIRNEVREYQFPKPGPRGPREDVAPPQDDEKS